MLLTLVLWFIGIITLVVIYNVKDTSYRFPLWLIPILLIIFLPTIVTFNHRAPINDYPNMAVVTIRNTGKVIYFSTFIQNDNKVIIDQYCIDALHWFDFSGYTIVNTPLTIILSDNDNKFIYKDRLTGITYNDTNRVQEDIATQP